MKTLKNIALFAVVLVLGISLQSCEQKSLQNYFVENSENPDFEAYDFALSKVLSSFTDDPEQKAVLSKIKKISVLSFEKDNPAEMKKEATEIDAILANSDYQELMRVTQKGMKINVSYLGKDDNIKEVVLYSKNIDNKLLLARVLTDGLTIDQLSKITGKLTDLAGM